MFSRFFSQKGLRLLLATGIVAISSVWMIAGHKPQDAFRKATKPSRMIEDARGSFAGSRYAPQVYSASAAFSTVQNSGPISFDVTGQKRARKKEVPQRTAPVAPLRACVTYNLDNSAYGMVEVTADGLNVLREHEGLQAAWGGTNVGSSKYFNVCAEVSGGIVQDVETYLWDASTWRNIEYDQSPDLNVLSYSMTCDPVTETVYGCFFSSDLQNLEIGTLDPLTMKRTGTIGTVDTPLFAMGFSSDGTLYGIDNAGALYKVSLTDASYTKVADTGITTTYNTTGAIDTFSDVFYYAACPAGPSDDIARDWALYSIDLKNGYKVEKCWDLNAELGGMYVANAAAKSEAPAAPVLNSISFEDGSLSGKVSFTAPDTTFGGDTLTGELEYGIIANGKTVKTGTVMAGNSAEVELALTEATLYAISVYVTNEAGISPKSGKISQWIGNGMPLVPTGVAVDYTYGDNDVTFSWQPVTESVSNGYFNADKVTYSVFRSIDGGQYEKIADHVAATEVKDNVSSVENATIYRYAVCANHEELTTEMVYGDYFTVGVVETPFAPDFSDELTQGYFTSKDYQGMGLKWKYSSYDQAMMMFWNAPFGSVNMDAALLSAPVKMEGGKLYEISYDVFVESYYTYGVGLQWGADPENLTTVIEPVSVNSSTTSYLDPLRQCVTVSPAADGVYYFAVRVLSNGASNCKLFVNNISVSAGLETSAPSAVTDVTFTPYYNGAKKLDISMKAPTTTIDGDPLTEITKIEVVRGGNTVKTFISPAVGETLSFTDQGTANEDVDYTIVAYNSNGAGTAYHGSAHMGVNMPVSPADCAIVQDLDNPGMVTVSWTPVAKDINGFDIDPSLLRYAIFASDYETIIASNLTASNPQCTFRARNENCGQSFVWYCVVPYTEGGVNGYDGGFGRTPMIPVGTPFETPYFESFAGGLHYPMGQIGASLRLATEISSQHLTLASQDGDNGLIALYTPGGTYCDLFTANITLDDTDDMGISFYYAGVPGMDGYELTPYVICDGVKQTVGDVINTKDCEVKGWNKVMLSLAPWKGKTIQFGFYIYCNDNPFAFGLDNIAIKRFAAKDLRAGAVSGPSALTIGINQDVAVEIVNDGYEAAPAGYAVDLYADDELVQTVEGPAVDAYATGVATFSYMPNPFAEEYQLLYAVIRWDDDEVTGNNESESVAIPVAESPYPGVTDLTAALCEDKASADIAWTEPVHEAEMRTITESFETYDPFTIAGFGDWSVFDGDGEETWWIGRPVYIPGVGSGPSYDNAKTPKAWMVVDGTKMNVDYAVSRTGDKAAMASSISGVADDWLISPELPGIAQTVSFFAATAPEDCGEESFEFYYSTTGTAPEDFIPLGDVVDVPEGDWVEDEDGDEYQQTTWYEYSYELPEDAKYFAIHYVTDDVYAMLVDDITFTVSDEVLAVQGYNLFRNGRMISELQPATAFHDDMEGLEPGEYYYAVTTVYDKGQSGISNMEVVVLPVVTGVDGVMNAKASVIAGKGHILIKGATGLDVTVSNAAGVAVYNGIPTGDLRIPATQGVHMVKIGTKAAKIMVK